MATLEDIGGWASGNGTYGYSFVDSYGNVHEVARRPDGSVTCTIQTGKIQILCEELKPLGLWQRVRAHFKRRPERSEQDEIIDQVLKNLDNREKED